MKRSELFFSFLLVPVDYLMILAAGLVAYLLRYETFLVAVRPIPFEISLGEYFRIIAAVAFLWLPIFAVAQLYHIRATRRLVYEFARVVLACSTGLTAIVFVIFFRHELFGSRFIVLSGWLFAILFVFAGRFAVRMAQRSLFIKNIGAWRVVVFGDSVGTYHLIRALKDDPKSGYRVVRHFRKLDDASLGSLAAMAKHDGADMVMHADPNHPRSDVERLSRFAHEHHLDFSYAADTLDAQMRSVEITDLGGIPVVQIKRTPLDGWGRIVKRIADIVISAAALILLSPLYGIVALAIKLDSPGPVFVRLTRVGAGGSRFQLIKFRSMVDNAHTLKAQLAQYNERSDGPLFKMKDDPRITRVGKIIRRLSIDELPNLYNAFRGDLSVVGPRPHEPEEVGRYTSHQKRLLNSKPGITGLAQVSGRSDLGFEEEARLDIYYIENWSFWLDLQILLRTPWVVIRGKSAV